MSKKILVIGSANIDLSMNMFKVPAPGETLIDDGGVAYTPGGKGANAALAFKKLGGAAGGDDLHAVLMQVRGQLGNVLFVGYAQ